MLKMTNEPEFLLDNLSDDTGACHTGPMDFGKPGTCGNTLISISDTDSLYNFTYLLPIDARVRALAAAWARKDHDLANAFLQNRDSFGLVEVLKALTLLDSSRRIRVEEKKVKRLQVQGAKIKPKQMGKFKSNIDNLTACKPKVNTSKPILHIRT